MLITVAVENLLKRYLKVLDARIIGTHILNTTQAYEDSCATSGIVLLITISWVSYTKLAVHIVHMLYTHVIVLSNGLYTKYVIGQ